MRSRPNTGVTRLSRCTAPIAGPKGAGYKVIRVRMKDGSPTGEYEDFMTGFVVDNDSVWGRPAGVAVTRDGTLLVSDDANGTIFRVTRSNP
jgi:glucose/arabinose dehydrogenase